MRLPGGELRGQGGWCSMVFKACLDGLGCFEVFFDVFKRVSIFECFVVPLGWEYGGSFCVVCILLFFGGLGHRFSGKEMS